MPTATHTHTHTQAYIVPRVHRKKPNTYAMIITHKTYYGIAYIGDSLCFCRGLPPQGYSDAGTLRAICLMSGTAGGLGRRLTWLEWRPRPPTLCAG